MEAHIGVASGAPAGENAPMHEPIPIEKGPDAPDLRGVVSVRQDEDGVIDALAADLLMQAHACVRAFGDFHLALSGGSTPQPLYRRLMFDPNYRNLPWKRTHLWIVDERCVPFDDERSNFGMIRELIVEPSDMPPEQVHPIVPLLDDSAAAYERELEEHLKWREPGHDRLDFVVLGMGEDGHVASLFPGSPALDDGGRLVLANEGPAVTPPPRITMTMRLLNASRVLALMVVGERKREAIARAQRGEDAVETFPVLGLDPSAGALRWYLDWEACPSR